MHPLIPHSGQYIRAVLTFLCDRPTFENVHLDGGDPGVGRTAAVEAGVLEPGAQDQQVGVGGGGPLAEHRHSPGRGQVVHRLGHTGGQKRVNLRPIGVSGPCSAL